MLVLGFSIVFLFGGLLADEALAASKGEKSQQSKWSRGGVSNPGEGGVQTSQKESMPPFAHGKWNRGGVLPSKDAATLLAQRKADPKFCVCK
jgi:hypothetical protein